MYHISWLINIKVLFTIISLDGIQCSIDGNFIPRRRNATKSVDDPCNPLYWYPRQIPEYCYYKKEMAPPKIIDPRPIPMPIPVPLPPISAPMPMLPQIIPQPIMPLPYPLPFGIPLAPANPMMPVAGIPFPPQPMFPPLPPPPPPPPLPHHFSPFSSYLPPHIQRTPISMVPGLPGLVAPDGGINILPFSDAYAELLERHKQKMIRKRLQKLLDEYDKFPSRNSNEDMKHYHNDINMDEDDLHFKH